MFRLLRGEHLLVGHTTLALRLAAHTVVPWRKRSAQILRTCPVETTAVPMVLLQLPLNEARFVIKDSHPSERNVEGYPAMIVVSFYSECSLLEVEQRLFALI